MVPGASVAFGSPMLTTAVTFDGYRTFVGSGTLSSPAGSGHFALYALRPEPGATYTDVPSLHGRTETVFAGCAGLLIDYPSPERQRCEERSGPAGSRITVGRYTATPRAEDVVTVVFTDGTAVLGRLASGYDGMVGTALTPDQLAEILADPSLSP
jgi:hypothetical protein